MRSSEFATISPSELDQAPDASGFELGPVRWDLHAYETDPKLEPFRDFFRSKCGGKVGLDAAICLTRAIARVVPFGAPAQEFVDSSYDPAADLQDHLHGAPGHCVTFSGLVTTALLADSIPARQVQMVVESALGHNILEVWDGRWGWVSIDPTYERLVVDPTGQPGAIDDALKGGAAWPHFGKPSGSVTSDTGFYTRMSDLTRQGHPPTISYPEPWLYTRSGEHYASWPFRAVFVQTGGTRWSVGLGQRALRLAGLLLALASAVCGAMAWLVARRRRRLARDAREQSVVPPEPAEQGIAVGLQPVDGE